MIIVLTRLIICSTLSTVCSTKQMQIMHILTTRLPWIWNLTNSFEIFETTGRIAYLDKWPTQNLTIAVFRVVYFLELLVINTFKRRDSPIRWIRLLLSLGQLPHVGVIYGVYNFVVWKLLCRVHVACMLNAREPIKKSLYRYTIPFDFFFIDTVGIFFLHPNVNIQ